MTTIPCYDLFKSRTLFQVDRQKEAEICRKFCRNKCTRQVCKYIHPINKCAVCNRGINLANFSSYSCEKKDPIQFLQNMLLTCSGCKWKQTRHAEINKRLQRCYNFKCKQKLIFNKNQTGKTIVSCSKCKYFLDFEITKQLYINNKVRRYCSKFDDFMKTCDKCLSSTVPVERDGVRYIKCNKCMMEIDIITYCYLSRPYRHDKRQKNKELKPKNT